MKKGDIKLKDVRRLRRLGKGDLLFVQVECQFDDEGQPDLAAEKRMRDEAILYLAAMRVPALVITGEYDVSVLSVDDMPNEFLHDLTDYVAQRMARTLERGRPE